MFPEGTHVLVPSLSFPAQLMVMFGCLLLLLFGLLKTLAGRAPHNSLPVCLFLMHTSKHHSFSERFEQGKLAATQVLSLLAPSANSGC